MLVPEPVAPTPSARGICPTIERDRLIADEALTGQVWATGCRAGYRQAPLAPTFVRRRRPRVPVPEGAAGMPTVSVIVEEIGVVGALAIVC